MAAAHAMSPDPTHSPQHTAVQDAHHTPDEKHADRAQHTHTSQVHTPPTTDEASHKDDDAASTSSLSDLGNIDLDHDLDLKMEFDGGDADESNRQRFEEAARRGAEEERLSEVKPDRYENGVPIFRPTMEQFQDFEKYVKGVDPYGMQSGIVLIDPPEEWKQQRKALDDLVKTIKIKNPITQEFHGAQGIYTQRNMEKMRSYNLPQWKAICEQTENQPPAKRGEKRLNADKLLGRGATRTRKSEGATTPSSSTEPGKRRPGRPSKVKREDFAESDSNLAGPPTPTSPATQPIEGSQNEDGEEGNSVEPTPTKSKKGKKTSQSKPRGRTPRQPGGKRDAAASHKGSETTVAARRLRNAGAAADEIDEEAFVDFDYRYHDHDQFTAERCEELEDKYWKSLNFSNPMYAADMPGSLFDKDTTAWNVAKLPNLLDLLGQPIPGVNTAYLYLGMWRATFAWHLEDVDLYSINYIHFGAPKQWYSVSQKDAPKFEAAMKSIWSQDAKNCDQFLRHKTYLVSPSLLKSKYGVQVNKVVHREGQFVITFPIGYHSGYNLGYNCAESVNFAIENWLQYGKTARKCQCESDSVFIDVDWFIRRMNGEPSPEFEEIEVTDDEDDEAGELMTPAPSEGGKGKTSQKRKRAPKELGPNKKAKKIVKVKKVSKVQPCCLCPNDFPYEELLPTAHGQRAHRTCAMYTPETYIATHDGAERVFNVENISKARLDLRCHECKQKKGSCFQCSSAKCTRAYHATCAMQAGVQVDKGDIAVWHEGVEYRDVGFDWRCKLHRTVKRTRITSELSACNHANGWINNREFVAYLTGLKPGELVQWQAMNTDDIEAGVVVSGMDFGTNSMLVSVLPDLRVVKEVEPSWILYVDSSTSCLQKPSANALELPEDLQGMTASMPDSSERKPSEGDPFTEDPKTEWAEFVSHEPPVNKSQIGVNLSKERQVWHYLGEKSTDSKAQYTADPLRPVHDPASNFLETVGPVKSAMAPPPQPRRQSVAATYPAVDMAARFPAISHAQPSSAAQQTAHNLGPAPSETQNHARVSPAKDKVPEMPHGSHQPKPSHNHDAVVTAAASTNEQARILQRQPAQPQQSDMSSQAYGTHNIGIDHGAIFRQKQFQQQASHHSSSLSQTSQNVFDKPMPTLQQFHQPMPNFGNGGFGQYDDRRSALHFNFSNNWMHSHGQHHAPVFSPIDSPAMPQMKTESPQLMQSTMAKHPPPVSNPGNTQSGGHFPKPQSRTHSRRNSVTQRSRSNSTAQTIPVTQINGGVHGAHGSHAPSREMSRPGTSHAASPWTPIDIERQRRISNPAYPFKSPEQIAAQKEERERHGSQSSGSRPSSRPGSGYTTTALPSPGLHPQFGPHLPPEQPMFINPIATQISPPGATMGHVGGHRPKSDSISGAIGPMGPPTQLMPAFRRSMSSGHMSTVNLMKALGTFGPSGNTLGSISQPFSRPPSKPLTATKSRMQEPDAPIAAASERLLTSLQPRPLSPGGLPLNDRSTPPTWMKWQEAGGFWGRVGNYYARKHDQGPTVYKSPFGEVDHLMVPSSVSGLDGLAGRYYQGLDDQGRHVVNEYRNQRGSSN